LQEKSITLRLFPIRARDHRRIREYHTKELSVRRIDHCLRLHAYTGKPPSEESRGKSTKFQGRNKEKRGKSVEDEATRMGKAVKCTPIIPSYEENLENICGNGRKCVSLQQEHRTCPILDWGVPGWKGLSVQVILFIYQE
jgi:hypothetical protein